MTHAYYLDFLNHLARCTATPRKGVTRFSYSKEDREARRIVESELARIGLSPWTDWVGNIHARLPGKDPGLPALIIGSHLDSVRHGGRYDGVVGVAGALAALERLTLRESQPERSVRFAAFAEEEGSNFNLPLLGSKAFVGDMTPHDLLSLRSGDGRTALEVLSEFGLPARGTSGLSHADECGLMLELHVEQSGQLEEAGAQIGSVEAIVADYAMTVVVDGRAGHSGATPMKKRNDAMTGAAEMMLACESLANASEGEGAVLTTGRIVCVPNSFNCISEKVEFTVDLRHPEPVVAKRVLETAEQRIEKIAARRGLLLRKTVKFTPGMRLCPILANLVCEEAEKMRFVSRRLPSWAMHDAGALAQKMRVGMIFVPSRDGLSHHPDEYTDPEDIVRGMELLYAVTERIADGGAL